MIAAAATVVAVAAVVSGAVLITSLGGGSGDPRAAGATVRVAGSTGSGAATSAAVPMAAPACGSTTPPLPLHLPDGYRGPFTGPATGGPAPSAADQLVLHWRGGGGDIELRWPADPSANGPVGSDDLSFTGPLAGTPDVVATVLVPGREDACANLRLAFSGPVPAGFGDRVILGRSTAGVSRDVVREYRALEALVRGPAGEPLVTGTTRVAALPAHAIACTGGSVPNRTGRTTSAAPAADPEAALRAFLAPADGSEPAVVAGVGYRRLVDAAGRIMFARPFDGGSGYVALVRMARARGGWVVDGWETSGC